MKTFQSKMKPKYHGTENLEVMSEAVNYNNFLVDQILKCAPESNDVEIFDFGAGIGQFSSIWNDARYNFRAIEIDPNFIKILKSKGITVTQLEKIEKSSADYIYTINVLEHIENDQSVIIKLHNILKADGKLLVYVPAFEFLWTPMDDFVGHVRRYKKNEIQNKFEQVGFEIEKLEYVDSAGFFAILVLKIFTKTNGIINPKTLRFFDKYCFPVGRILDELLFKYCLGKNLLLVAKKLNS